MKKVAEGLYRQITRRKTSNGIKEYTYYYTKGTGKRKYERQPVIAAKQRMPLTQGDLDRALQEVSDKATQQALRNEIKYMQKQGKTPTIATLENLLRDEKLDKQQQFINNLGYSEEEFEEEFGLTVSDLRAGSFRNVDGVIEFTGANNQKRYFIWDYDKGLIEK